MKDWACSVNNVGLARLSRGNFGGNWALHGYTMLQDLLIAAAAHKILIRDLPPTSMNAAKVLVDLK